MDKVWVLAKVGYDEFTIVGIYSSEELANSARQECEAAEVATGERRRLRSRTVREDEGLTVIPFPLDHTRLHWAVTIRADGEVIERHAWVGHDAGRPFAEQTFRGDDRTEEAALARAREALAHAAPAKAAVENSNAGGSSPRENGGTNE